MDLLPPPIDIALSAVLANVDAAVKYNNGIAGQTCNGVSDDEFFGRRLSTPARFARIIRIEHNVTTQASLSKNLHPLFHTVPDGQVKLKILPIPLENEIVSATKLTVLFHQSRFHDVHVVVFHKIRRRGEACGVDRIAEELCTKRYGNQIGPIGELPLPGIGRIGPQHPRKPRFDGCERA